MKKHLPKNESALYFSDFFNISEKTIEDYGAFNVSLIVDLPLFVDPFLLFNSKKKEYIKLHEDIIGYLIYLKDISSKGELREGRLRHLFCFPEVQQNWFGFSQTNNRGRGLGMIFAKSLASSLNVLFSDFGKEQITQGSHLEKLCLIREGVGRDMISDFTTNLIRRFLCEYTEIFTKKHLNQDQCACFSINNIDFNKDTGTWAPAKFTLPKHLNDYVLLTPKDILTKDDIWINKEDFAKDYFDIPTAIGDTQLRDKIEAYFRSVLPKKPTVKDTNNAIRKTALEFPQLIDYYIKLKEKKGNEASRKSLDKVSASLSLYVKGFGELVNLLRQTSDFYKAPLSSKFAAIEKINFLKDVIENKGGYKLFYHDRKPIRKEEDLQICYRLVWHGTKFDVSREVNDGRGPADFKISDGSSDKTIVEMKLGNNTGLERNLENQAEIYQKASDAPHALKVILCFTANDLSRVRRILKRLKLDKCPDIFIIDGRRDNKPSASKV